MNNRAEKLLNCFLEIEENSFPESLNQKAKERSEKVRNLINKYGVNHVTVNNYTNMMQFLSSVTIDCFNSKRWEEGDITIDLGSELHELWALRRKNNGTSEIFNFKTNRWNKSQIK